MLTISMKIDENDEQGIIELKTENNDNCTEKELVMSAMMIFFIERNAELILSLASTIHTLDPKYFEV